MLRTCAICVMIDTPLEAYSFLLEWTPFQNQKSQKIVSLVKKSEKKKKKKKNTKGIHSILGTLRWPHAGVITRIWTLFLMYGSLLINKVFYRSTEIKKLSIVDPLKVKTVYKIYPLPVKSFVKYIDLITFSL